jgi:hypothetical protein
VLWIEVVTDSGIGGVAVETAADLIIEEMAPDSFVKRLGSGVWLVYSEIPNPCRRIIGKRHINAAIFSKR